MPPPARGRRPPVTLRDFLELCCESASSNGFRSYPRRLPPSHEQASSAAAAELSRSPSWSPSAFFLAAKSPVGSALARISSLSRSFSQRISFWRRREYDDDLDDRDSCGFPSPQVSSCSASEYAESETDIVVEETSPAAVSGEVSVSASAPSSGTDRTDVPCAAGDGHDEAHADGEASAVGRKLETMEDKQQLSPVSVLDFPFDDDDGDEEERSDAGSCSPSLFQHRHNCAAANGQRKKKKKEEEEAQHKIRLFDGPTTEASSVEDLEARFTTSSSESGEEESVDDVHAHLPSSESCCTDDDGEAAKTTTVPRGHDYAEDHQSTIDERSSQGGQEEPDECRLLAKLLDDGDTAAVLDEISEWLLVDFFAEGIDRLRSYSMAGPVVGTAKMLDDGSKVMTAALVDAAMDWMRGAGPQWGIGDVMFSGESALKDMERGRRWICVREEEQDIGAEVEAFVMHGLLDELLTELICGAAPRGTRGTASAS